jgi:hypothetical protein
MILTDISVLFEKKTNDEFLPRFIKKPNLND